MLTLEMLSDIVTTLTMRHSDGSRNGRWVTTDIISLWSSVAPAVDSHWYCGSTCSVQMSVLFSCLRCINCLNIVNCTKSLPWSSQISIVIMTIYDFSDKQMCVKYNTCTDDFLVVIVWLLFGWVGGLNVWLRCVIVIISGWKVVISQAILLWSVAVLGLGQVGKICDPPTKTKLWSVICRSSQKCVGPSFDLPQSKSCHGPCFWRGHCWGFMVQGNVFTCVKWHATEKINIVHLDIKISSHFCCKHFIFS
jgi:hypothetical protein